MLSTDKCENYCENNGICKKNEEGEPLCECSGSFTGSKCQVRDIVTFVKRVVVETDILIHIYHSLTHCLPLTCHLPVTHILFHHLPLSHCLPLNLFTYHFHFLTTRSRATSHTTLVASLVWSSSSSSLCCLSGWSASAPPAARNQRRASYPSHPSTPTVHR